MKKSSLYIIIIFSLIINSCKNENRITKELTFLTFNVWQEGVSVPNGLSKIHDVILKVNPDVVCFTEVRNYQDQDWTTKIINALEKSGQKYYRGYIGGDVSFISKYPIENGKKIFNNKGTIVNFNLNLNGNTINISGAHLHYKYYASNLPRGYYGSDPDWKIINDGNGNPTPFTVLDSVQAYGLKSTRDEAISSFLEFANLESNPVILMGDFNEPSCLDWTENTKNMFDHNGLVIPWHNTKQLQKAGFVDVFREFFPNEVDNPGFTWPSFANEKKSTSWAPLADERDRIDFIFSKGNGIKIEDVSIVGPKESYVYNKLETLNTNKEKFIANELPWPSDHKAVYAKLLFTFQKKNN